MTYQEIHENIIKRAAQTIGCPYTYNAFKVGSAPDPAQRYILFRYPNRNDFLADDKNYAHITSLDIELYSVDKDFEAESVIEGILEEQEITYIKTDAYIEDEQMYMCLYEMEVNINAEQ